MTLTKTFTPLKQGSKSISEILSELKATSSKIEKENILIREKDAGNELLPWLFYVALDPTIKFYVKNIPEFQTTREIYDIELALRCLLENLATRQKTGHEALDYLKFILGQTVKDEVEILINIIKKDINVGVQTTTVNKIWKNLIKDPPYLQYTLFSKKLLNKFPIPCISEIKYDGLYSDTFCSATEPVYHRARSGLDVNVELKKSLQEKLSVYADGMVLHGEMLVFNEDHSVFLPREIGNGLINSGEVKPEDICLVCWDAVTTEEYNNRKSNRPLTDRRELLEKVHAQISDENFQLSDIVLCNSVQDVIDHFIWARKNKLEGTVVKSLDLKWKDGKTNQGLKLKNIFDVEMRVTKTIPHSKKPNQIGALSVESEDGIVWNDVGSGLTDAQRKRFYSHTEEILNKIVTIRANDLLESETKEGFSLFLPRLVEVRVDKTKANTYNEILEAKDSIIELLKTIGE